MLCAGRTAGCGKRRRRGIGCRGLPPLAAMVRQRLPIPAASSPDSSAAFNN
jgi:hypothetical protein